MILISNLTLNIKDGSTIASTNIYGEDKKTYINIGSGNVFKLEWGTPTLTNDDTVDRYRLVIKRHDTTLNVYYDIFDKNIGLVNEYYVDSPMLPALPEQYMLSVYLVAYGKQGSVVTSNVINPYISKGSGTYVNVKDENSVQSIMKRAAAFAKTPSLTKDIPVLVKTEDGNLVPILDDNGNEVPVIATRILESTNGWSIMQEGYTKDAEGNWHTANIRYEVLQVLNNDGKYEVLRDTSNEPIYIL